MSFNFFIFCDTQIINKACNVKVKTRDFRSTYVIAICILNKNKYKRYS